VPETRIVLKNCEIIDPKELKSYLDQDGFTALKKCEDGMSSDEVITEIKGSGLQGRGGAGFNCGLKWELARKSPEQEKYLICNADEGEIGAFKDRYILTHDPFSIIEGMAIAAYAIGAKKAYIYLRREYHSLLADLKNSLKQVGENGFLKNLDIQVFEGAGSYICGEETALMDSIEGNRGEARYKPPFPPVKGLYGQPTIINNVETLANIPHIILKGAEWFKAMGTDKSKGTKVFSISGDVERPGVYELLMGTPLKELVLDLAGAENVKAVQIGGASGKILPADMLDIPLAYEHVMGSGSVIVFNQDRDMIDIVYRDIDFLADESCGKCTPCREGTEVMMEIYTRLVNNESMEEDIEALKSLSQAMQLASICGLGQSAPTPVLDSLEYFRDEYDQRLTQSRFLRSLKEKTII